MIAALICILSVFAVLCVSEYLWRTKRIHGEAARKFVHIIVGTFIAFWPFLMSMQTIQLISLAFIFVILLSRYMHIFHAIHNVKRKTWGELLFAVSIGLIPFISDSRVVFTAAILHMSLADGLAGLIGTRYGKRTRFTMFGQTKSIVGSLTFAIISYVLVLGFFKASRVADLGDINLLVVALPLLATLLETASVKGLDNFFVPVLVAMILNSTL